MSWPLTTDVIDINASTVNDDVTVGDVIATTSVIRLANVHSSVRSRLKSVKSDSRLEVNYKLK